MNKRAQFVTLIAIAIAAIILLLFFKNSIIPLLKFAGGQTTCNLNLFISAAVKAGSLGFAEVPPGCEAEYLTISKDDIGVRKNIAKKRLDKYYQDNTGYYSDARNVFGVAQGVTDTAMNEWALDSILGKEMVGCWNKVWHGKLDVFGPGGIKGFFSGKHVFCVVCSVVTFSDDLPININDQVSVNSLYAWMKAEPYYKTTYYDYMQGQSIMPDQSSLFFTTKIPISVVFIEEKEGWLSKNWVELSLWTADIALTVALPGVGKVAGAGLRVLARLSTAGLTTRAASLAIKAGKLATTAEKATKVVTAAEKGVTTGVGAVEAGAIATAITDEAIEKSDTLKVVVIHPYELITKDMKDGGLGCTDIVA